MAMRRAAQRAAVIEQACQCRCSCPHPAFFRPLSSLSARSGRRGFEELSEILPRKTPVSRTDLQPLRMRNYARAFHGSALSGKGKGKAKEEDEETDDRISPLAGDIVISTARQMCSLRDKLLEQVCALSDPPPFVQRLIYHLVFPC
jgi:hypothetical protein